MCIGSPEEIRTPPSLETSPENPPSFFLNNKPIQFFGELETLQFFEFALYVFVQFGHFDYTDLYD
jgi:hypothetical protein